RAGVAIFALALVVRLVFVALFQTTPTADMTWNDAVSWNLATGRGFTASVSEPTIPAIYRTPGYPAFLGAVYFVFGHKLIAAYVAQAVVDALTAVLVAGIARALASAAIASLAGVLYALYPYPAMLCGILQQDV